MRIAILAAMVIVALSSNPFTQKESTTDKKGTSQRVLVRNHTVGMHLHWEESGSDTPESVVPAIVRKHADGS